MNKKQLLWLLFLYIGILVLGSFGLSLVTEKPFHYYVLILLAIVGFSVLVATVITATIWVYESLGD